MLTARHLLEKLYQRADNNRGDVILELPNGDRFRVTDPEVTGVPGQNLIAQDLAVARLVPVTPQDEPSLLGGADWQVFSNDIIGSRVFLTGYDMDVMPQGRIDLIGRTGSTQESTLYRETFRKTGSAIGKGIAEIGKNVGEDDDFVFGRRKKAPEKLFDDITSPLLESIVGVFAADQAFYFDDCVWLSSDMVCSTGANGAPVWLQAENGRFVVVGVQSEPHVELKGICGGTRIYVASSPESNDSVVALIKNFK
jgi:hypothetical protein